MGIFANIKRLFSRDAAGGNDTAGTPEASAPLTPRQGGDYSLLASLYSYNGGTALSVATVYRCIKLLSESVADLPLRYMRLKDGIFAEDTNSRLHYLLTVQPDVAMSAYDFWVQVIQYVLTDGNAYIVPVYNPVSFDVDRLVLCGRGTVSHDTTNDTYYVTDYLNGIIGQYDEDEIIHIKNLSIDGKNGVSTLTYARLTLNIAGTGDTETLNRFANGGNVRGLITNDNSVRGFGEYQDAELAKEATNVDEQFRGGHRIVSLPGQVEFKQLSLSSTDMQFLESRKFTVREICRFFGVHPSYVFDDTSNNYKSAEMANVAFLSSTLNPLLRRIEVELHRKLVAPSLCCKRKFEFDRRSLYACDLDSRVKYQTQTIAAGIYTVNDWRRQENQPAVEGGDTVLVSANLKDINDKSFTTAQPNSTPKKDKDDEE